MSQKYDAAGDRKRRRGKRRNKTDRNESADQGRQATATVSPNVQEGPITLPSVLSVGELADALQRSAVEVIKELMGMGIMATINQQVDFETAEKVAGSFGIEVVEHVPEAIQTASQDVESRLGEAETDPDAQARPPIVTVMGHVDHGKTKLLDAIRKTQVAESEAGGITQKIGAYQADFKRRKITFLDTPGHEAFTAMRARGAQATDVAVLVVAADDGVMPQTMEAISHAQAAEVPMVVAINKVDLPAANPDYVKQQLAERGVIPEDYGGDVPTVEISAKEQIGIDDLMEVILLVADIQDLKANPNKPAVGVIVEAEVDRNQGVAATALVQSGTLQLRDIAVAGATYGRIRAMYDDHGKRIRRAEPSTPVLIYGLVDLPEAGDVIHVVDDERRAREIAEERFRHRQADALVPNRFKLDDVYSHIEEGGIKDLPLVVKADTQGSLGAVQGTLSKLAEESESVKLSIVHTGTGLITESDVNLAIASGAIIIGFNVRPDPAARRAAEAEGIDIRFYDVIYHLTDDIQSAMKGLLGPEERETTDGYAEVRDTFRLPNRVVVAGLYVTDGKISRNSRARVLRNGAVIADTGVASLKRFKDDVREVASGYECGLTLDGFTDFETGDLIEFYRIEEVART